MKIGFFDSGFGGLTILKEVVKKLPDYSYLYLGDNARAPYGSRDQETIYEFTKQGVEKLFTLGAQVVVLACNTSSSSALRRLQQEWLPEHYLDRRVLGIIVPTAEEIGRHTKTGRVGVLGTEATVSSEAYPKEIQKRASSNHEIGPREEIIVYQQACPLLVPMIEAGEAGSVELEQAVNGYLAQLFAQDKDIDAVILGCTHYGLIEDVFAKNLPAGVTLVSQGKLVAEKLADYLARHPELEGKLECAWERHFYSTEDSERITHLAAEFFGAPIKVEAIILD
ncbi:MAG: glutamate racemase [bacterium]